MQDTYVGLDLGTSGLKALLVDSNGKAIGEATSTYEVLQPHEGWCEQNPNDWIEAACQVFHQLRQSYPLELSHVRGIGISGHMHGAVLVDRDCVPLRPCILWNDVRSSSQASQLNKDIEFHKITGNIVFPGFTAPKLLWVKENEPHLFNRLHKVLLPKDFLVHWFTGQYSTDVSDAAGTSWLNVERREWSDTLLQKTFMNREHMCQLYESCEIIGTIRTIISKEYGIPKETGVVSGGGDNAVAGCGLGVFSEGEAFLSLGTSGVIFVGRDKYTSAYETAVHTFCHAIPGKWYQMGVMLSATASLDWLCRLLTTDLNELIQLVPTEAQGPSRIRFLPYLNGERTPHNESRSLGTFIGLASNTTRADLVKAVMEGVAFGLKDCMEAIRSTGTRVTEVIATGGGSKNDFWLDTLAQTLGVTIKIPESGEFGAALGAARLAIVGVNVQKNGNENYIGEVNRIMTAPKISKSFPVRPHLAQQYEAAYRRYAATYYCISGTM